MNRLLLVFVVMGVFVLLPPQSASAAQAMSERIDAFGELKFQVLAAEARIEAALHPAGDHPGAGARLYVSDAAADFELDQIGIAIDGGPLTSLSIAAEDARSLSGSGDLLWLKDVPLAQGAHQLHVEILARSRSKPDQAALQLASNAPVETASGDSAVEIALAPPTLLSPPQIKVLLRERKDVRRGWLTHMIKAIGILGGEDLRYSQGRANDPAMRFVNHLVKMGQADAAVVELLRISQDPGNRDALPAEFWLALSSALRTADMPDQAQAICDRLDAEHAERQAVGLERLRIGMQQYREGSHAKAEAQLLSAQGRVPEHRVQDWQVAYAQILFDKAEFAAAGKVLQSGNVDSDDAYRFMQDSIEAVRTSAYRRFNLAVAMVQSGQLEKGLSLLDLVGRLKSTDDELLAIRDKANLMLGWHFLRARQGITAMGMLGRVRSDGQYSSAAVLGMGWAELAPPGKKLARVHLGDDTDADANILALPAALKNSLSRLGVLEPELRGAVEPGRFASDRPARDPQEAMRRALKIWNLLPERDTQDAAVQEGLLAIAYAFDQLDGYENSFNAYTQAISALETEKRAVETNSEFIRKGGLTAAIAEADNDADLTMAMHRLNLAPNDALQPLYASIDRYRDLMRIQHRLADYDSELHSTGSTDSSTPPAAADIPALLAALNAARQSESDEIRDLAQADLIRQHRGVDGYLKVAYLAAARAADNSLALAN